MILLHDAYAVFGGCASSYALFLEAKGALRRRCCSCVWYFSVLVVLSSFYCALDVYYLFLITPRMLYFYQQLFLSFAFVFQQQSYTEFRYVSVLQHRSCALNGNEDRTIVLAFCLFKRVYLVCCLFVWQTPKIGTPPDLYAIKAVHQKKHLGI